MGSDRARISYDPSRHWRGVISQQGRVTLEADWNEADAIAASERRQELLDIVGPAGTPDDGYQILPAASGSPAGDLTIQHGTLYVGGERMVLDSDLDYASQPDWTDTAGDPLWTAPAVPDSGTEAIYLLLRAQEVGAVEDPALLDVALGGPDTAARWRILQRVVRTPVTATDCQAGTTALEQLWAAKGLQLDPATLRLESQARLQVSFAQQQAPSLCEPSGQGGYLGAQNQLIRVQVASVDSKGVPTLVWGFDNASFLYRIAGPPVVDTAGGTTMVTLATAPVDSYHQPAQNQAVEILMAAAELTGSDYIAAATGTVTSVAAAGYNPDTGQLQLDTALDADVTSSPLLFLRVWQGTVPWSSPGPVQLGATGIGVAISTAGTAASTFHVGDYWTFAVRPGTPTTVSPVYPERIQDAPQPPDGPPMWACLLGLVTWDDGTPTITSCVPSFDNLVTLTERGGGCCTVEVGPADVDDGATLQKLIDDNSRGVPVTICLRPGTYSLPAPLLIGDRARLTIQACEPGVVLAAASADPQFLLGLVVAAGATDLTLRGLELSLAPAALDLSPETADGLATGRAALLSSYAQSLGVAIGIGLIGGGTGIAIEGCVFTFPDQTDQNLFAAGIFAAGALTGLTVADCTFAATEPDTLPFSDLRLGREVPAPYQLRFGYLQVPSQAPKEKVKEEEAARPDLAERGTTGLGGAEVSTVQANATVPALADATFTRDVFTGQTVPILVVGALGTVWVRDVTVRASYGGFWFLATADYAAVTLLDRLDTTQASLVTTLQGNGLSVLTDPVLWLAVVIGRLLPPTPPAAGTSITVLGTFRPSGAILQGSADLLARLIGQTPAAGSATAQKQDPAEKKSSGPARPAAAAEDTAAGVTQPMLVIKGVKLPIQLQNIFTADPTPAITIAPALDAGAGLTPRLDIHASQVDAIAPDSYSGAGLLIAILLTNATGASSAICTGNRIRSRVASGAAAGLYQIVECTMTGNIISNEIYTSPATIKGGLTPSNLSLLLAPATPVEGTPAVAVTGNVLIGDEPVWPERPKAAAPLLTWNPLNTVMTYSPALE